MTREYRDGGGDMSCDRERWESILPGDRVRYITGAFPIRDSRYRDRTVIAGVKYGKIVVDGFEPLELHKAGYRCIRVEKA